MKALEDLGREYEHGHDYAMDHRDKPTNEQDEKVAGGDVSDPTYAIAMGHVGGRSIIRKVSGRLQSGVPGIASVRWCLTQLEKLYETDDEWEPLRAYQHMSQAQTDEWKAAQKKRELRDTNAEIARLENRLRTLRGKVRRLA